MKEKIRQFFGKKLKWQTLVIVVIVLAILGFTGVIVYKRYFLGEKSFSLINNNKNVDNRIANDLDGTKVDPEVANRHPLAIMVENHPDSRPQAGLDKASIVYEAITEGGITRFMAIYGPQDAEKVGPVRSARTYFIDWLSEFNAFYAHVGGNLDALEKIKKDKIFDLDQFGIGTQAYWREPKAGIAVEHTMFTSTKDLYKVAFESKKWPKKAEYKALKFIKDKKDNIKGEGQVITIDFSSPQFKVTWTYDQEMNSYLREMGGRVHKDRITSEQLSAKNIIIMQMTRREAITAINESGFAMDTIGSDKAIIFRNGSKITGKWEKDSRTERTIFFDEQGNEIEFTPGAFWIEVVPPEVFSKLQIENITKPATE